MYSVHHLYKCHGHRNKLTIISQVSVVDPGGGGANRPRPPPPPFFGRFLFFLADFCYFRARHRGIWIPPPPPPFHRSWIRLWV